MVGVVQRFGKMVALERPIHPKCGEEACDLVAHSSKVWRKSMWLGGPFIQRVEEKHVTLWTIHPKVWRRSKWLGERFIQKCGGEASDLEAIHPKCGEEAYDLEAIHPKVWGKKHVTWRPFIQSVEEKHVTWWPIHPKCGERSMWLGGYSSKSVRGGTHDLGIQSVFGRKRWRAWNGERGETNDFGGNEYANPNFYTSPFLHNSYITCFLRKQYHKGWPTTTCLWKEAMMLMV